MSDRIPEWVEKSARQANIIAPEDPRPTWDEYFMVIASVVARRSDCVRDKVGAVVVKDNRIRSTGYNGAPAGKPGCSTCPRSTMDVPRNSDYDNCVALHAEANALIHCDRADLNGATVFVTREPCPSCAKLLAGSGVVRVVTDEDEDREESIGDGSGGFF